MHKFRSNFDEMFVRKYFTVDSVNPICKTNVDTFDFVRSLIIQNFSFLMKAMIYLYLNF